MRPLLIPLVLALAAAGCDRPSPPAAQDNGTAPDEVVADAAAAGIAKGIDRSHRGEAAPAHRFAGPDGETSLAAFRGKPVLVNLWATWCAPCIKELPTLDALAAKGSVRVVALSQDTDAAKARAFLQARGFKALPAYTDPDMRWLGGVTSNLPTTILYDAEGREVWRWLGDADWTGAEATAALAEA
jgi:thiol-disulfide isomerase/thioredoxin